VILKETSIKSLLLRNNGITYDSLMILAKSLEDMHRFEIEELDLSENNLNNKSV